MPRKKQSTGKKKTSTRKAKRNGTVKLDASDILLKGREIFLYESITSESAQRIIKELRALDALEKKPIKLWINSPGGEVHASFAIINTMRNLTSKVLTIINSTACSGAALVSMAGDERYITSNGVWMAHDMKAGIIDYSAKIESRAEYFKILWKQILGLMKMYTELDTREINRARSGELWLFADDALDKGVVDKILELK